MNKQLSKTSKKNHLVKKCNTKYIIINVSIVEST